MDGAALKAWIDESSRRTRQSRYPCLQCRRHGWSADPAAWESNFKLDAAVNAFDAAYPFLEKSAAANKDAAFVIIASVSAAESDNASSYGPIKAALIHYAKGLARQHAKRGIRTNVVSPGMVYFEGGVWAMVEKNMPDYFKQAMARNPTGRAATLNRTSPVHGALSCRFPPRPTRLA